MRKILPITAFILFLGAILAATLYYAPGWGLMDDYQNIENARDILHSPSPFIKFFENVWASTLSWGIFRPVYCLWIVVVYNLFVQSPTAIYILLVFLNMGAMLIWGNVFCRFYNIEKEDSYLVRYFFPLSFFLFTPFWNIFMYISLQEKFVVLFGAASFYFFKRSYDAVSNKYILTAFLFLLLGLCSKPTTLGIAAVYFLFAVLDCTLFKVRPAVSLKYIVGNGLLILAYMIFTFKIQMKGLYTAKYGHNLKPAIMLGKVLLSHLIIKFLFLLGIASVLFIIIRFLKTKDKSSVFGILFPLCLIAFLILLIPWGYQSYLLCDLAPFVLGIFFPVYIYAIRKSLGARLIMNVGISLLLTAVLMGIIFPRISKMGEIAKTEHFIISRGVEDQHSRYFFPPPFIESAGALKGFTGRDIVYLEDGVLDASKLTDGGNNYLLVNDQCSGISLKSVHVGEEIFANKTWQIFRLDRQGGSLGTFTPVFKNNIIQEIKTILQSS